MSRSPVVAVMTGRLGRYNLPLYAADAWVLPAAGALAVTVGYMVAQGRSSLLAVLVLGLTLVVASVVRPEALLIVWFVGILADGRWLTFHKSGPLYVTEPLLVVLAFGLAIRFLAVREREEVAQSSRRAMRTVLPLVLVIWLPGVVGLLVQTSNLNYASLRNFALVLYSLFAVIAASTARLDKSYRWWFAGVMLGSAIALLLVVSGHAGPEEETSTGAIRLASHTFALAFGIAPIVLLAATRERLIRSWVAALCALPFVIGLVFVNHRSAWIAFIAAMAVLFARRLSPLTVTAGLAVILAGVFVFSVPSPTQDSTFSQELTRAKSTFDTSDPNARFRLDFWKRALKRSADSPVIGSGFDPYPDDLVPEKSTVENDPFLGPHNSFVAFGYRLGLLPILLLLLLLGKLLKNGYMSSVKSSDPVRRAVCCALTGILVYAGVTSGFNVFLEAPYAGPLFWTTVGLLAVAIHSGDIPTQRVRASVRASNR